MVAVLFACMSSSCPAFTSPFALSKVAKVSQKVWNMEADLFGKYLQLWKQVLSLSHFLQPVVLNQRLKTDRHVREAGYTASGSSRIRKHCRLVVTETHT